jgi:hypothetical protein
MIARPAPLLTVPIKKAVRELIPGRLSTNENIGQNRYDRKKAGIWQDWKDVFGIPAKFAAEPVVPSEINLLYDQDTAYKPDQAEGVNEVKDKPEYPSA